jgi:hypothetical protein
MMSKMVPKFIVISSQNGGFLLLEVPSILSRYRPCFTRCTNQFAGRRAFGRPGKKLGETASCFTVSTSSQLLALA